MDCRIVFLPDSVEICVPVGTFLSDAAKQAGVWIDSPCGGNGTCKKCAVLLNQGGVESRVLSCQTMVAQDCLVTLERAGNLKTMRDGVSLAIAFAPLRAHMPSVSGACFAAIDLGTTSIVCYLLDGETGEQLASAGMQNPQAAYGADVIARANTVLNGQAPNAMRDSAVSALNTLIERTAKSAGRSPDQLTLVSIVGNTVMHHILLTLPLEQLVRAPYLPYATGSHLFPARELDLRVNASAKVMLPPVIGGFVGADTVACLTATAFDEIVQPTLLLDIGTNGELVCTDGARRVCCSTAAGPAFEGANISCGMRAEEGAVDHVWLKDGAFTASTIGDKPARGICGSGLIDLIAVLVSSGIIDETGRFCKTGVLSDRLIEQYGTLVFLVAEGGQQVTLSQRDVRELQLGKAAIRAGIAVLLDALHLAETQITRVLLAGAFGSHLAPDALCEIGLLPEAFRGKIESIGNAAGEGAKLYLKNHSLFEASESLARETAYIELTLSPAFSDYYIDAMAFPEAQL
jgi:uncharacterized 2Fe-2S/4Fe-4S cluster protein (DUF4445 family)